MHRAWNASEECTCSEEYRWLPWNYHGAVDPKERHILLACRSKPVPSLMYMRNLYSDMSPLSSRDWLADKPCSRGAFDQQKESILRRKLLAGVYEVDQLEDAPSECAITIRIKAGIEGPESSSAGPYQRFGVDEPRFFWVNFNQSARSGM